MIRCGRVPACRRVCPARGRRDLRRLERDDDTGERLVRDTGEPKIVQQVRQQFASWASVNFALFFLNVVTTQLSPPWFLFPAAGMGIGLLRNYAKLWQAGYSWRDVLSRPPAPDSIAAGKADPKLLGELRPPRVDEFGEYFDRAQQVWSDRNAIVRIVELPPLKHPEDAPRSWVTEWTFEGPMTLMSESAAPKVGIVDTVVSMDVDLPAKASGVLLRPGRLQRAA